MPVVDLSDPLGTTLSSYESRRSFLRHGMLAAVAGTVLACKPSAPQAPEQTAATPPLPPKGATGTDAYTATANVAASAERVAADEMDRMHEAGMKAFPAKTSGRGNELLAPRMDGKVKAFELEGHKAKWETAPGKFAEAWTYKGTVPGRRFGCARASAYG